LSSNTERGWIVQRRTGQRGNEFVNLSHPITVVNGKVTLDEIPNKFDSVAISNATTTLNTTENGLPDADTVVVNYNTGELHFDPTHNGAQFTVSYVGTGFFQLSAKRVFTETTNPDAVSNIQDMIDNYNNLNGVDLYTKFDPNSGHLHSGTAGDGTKIPAANIPIADSTGIIDALNVEDALVEHSNKIGVLTNLTTTDKGSLVASVNEVTSELAETETDLEERGYNARWNALLVVDGDWAPAINQAVQDAIANGKENVYLPKKMKLKSQLKGTRNIKLVGFNGNGGKIYRDATATYDTYADFGSIVEIEFGAGINEGTTSDTWNNYYANSAVLLEDRSSIEGVTFYYPSQVVSGTPTEYPPTIAIAPTSHNPQVKDVTFVNSYSAIDARRDHAHLHVENVRGFPLKWGIRAGSNNAEDTFKDVLFHSLFAYRVTTPSNTLVPWVAKNGVVFEIGRVSWTNIENCMAYGYDTGLKGYTQAADATKNINRGGSIETLRFVNSGFDGTYKGLDLIEKCYGVQINNAFFASFDPYDSTRVDGFAINYSPDGTGLHLDISINTIRVWGSVGDVIKISKAKHVSIRDLKALEYGSGATSVNKKYAVLLTDCEHVKVSDSSMDIKKRSNVGGVKVTGTSKHINVHDNSIKSATADVNAIVIDSGVTHYNIHHNDFEDGTLSGILDSSNQLESKIHSNNDTKYSIFKSDSAIVSGVFQVPVEGTFYKYTGITNITGISPSRRERMLVIRFSNAVTLTESASMSLAGTSFTTAVNDTITFVCDGSVWYEVSRNVN
jgi:hypothetical protein